MSGSVILQSHYQNRQSPDAWWAKNGKIGRRRPIVGRRRHRFWQNFWSADDFFVEAPKLKVSLTDLPIFRDFVIGETSGDGRPMIDRHSAVILKIFSSRYRPKVARSSGFNRPTIARRSIDDILSNNLRQTDAGYRPSFGRWSPNCRSIRNCGVYMCDIVNNACVNTFIMKYIMDWFYFGIHCNWPRVQVMSGFCVGFPIELYVWHFEINISTTSKRLQPNSGHSLIYVDWTIRMKFLNKGKYFI